MKEIIVHNQNELDKLPPSFKEYTYIYIQDTTERVYVKVARGNSTVVAWLPMKNLTNMLKSLRHLFRP